MDLALPLLADANLHLSAAEELFASGQRESARLQLEKAEQALEELREHYRGLDEAGQGLLAQMARPLGKRARELARLLPRTPVVTRVEGSPDPEEELPPEE